MKQITVQLQLEALGLFLVCLALYARLSADWQTFAALFFFPDFAILLYLVNPRVGGSAYNVSHFYGFPAALFLTDFYFGTTQYSSIALIWTAHLSFDRMLGWGLKLEDSFFNTHLGRRTILGWGISVRERPA